MFFSTTLVDFLNYSSNSNLIVQWLQANILSPLEKSAFSLTSPWGSEPEYALSGSFLLVQAIDEKYIQVNKINAMLQKMNRSK